MSAPAPTTEASGLNEDPREEEAPAPAPATTTTTTMTPTLTPTTLNLPRAGAAPTANDEPTGASPPALTSPATSNTAASAPPGPVRLLSDRICGGPVPRDARTPGYGRKSPTGPGAQLPDSQPADGAAACSCPCPP
ncbi:hypothetical protein VC83_05685 [Pseudogymnoascus destructans]|uniref:Uncharacterized protein n=2 Tax=Pseudogymnoascus destructans TaxID=655981 RepID=L8FQ91_PSED2|nr:uncharacterized protein VC83_05685 [Pseudogymnoascus destructans]ELR03120.1 hypothetical protein GMDG_05953 [Pseudogymnoascus destructans 20631-21]OAF57811.1 hypothetical protein VC83_05685 [Pseudogymnoascus destructans]